MFELDAVPNPRFEAFSQGADFLARQMKGKPPLGRQPLHEIQPEGVDGDVARPEAKASIRIPQGAQPRIEVGVFDALCAALPLHDQTDLLPGVGLFHHLDRHVRTCQQMVSQEHRIPHTSQGIVHLTVEDLPDAPFPQPVQAARPEQGAKAAPMSIGVAEERTGPRKKQLSLRRKSRKGPLADEAQVPGAQPEEAAALEESPGLGMVLRTRLENPGQRSAGQFPKAADSSRQDLKEAGPGDRAQRKGSFRPLEPQPGGLAAGDSDHRDPPGAQSLPADLGRPPRGGKVALRGRGNQRGRLQALGRLFRRFPQTAQLAI